MIWIVLAALLCAAAVEAAAEPHEHMLDMINQERTERGLIPVTLGTNIAAQSHADDMLHNCYASHWGINGLKPYMRYTLAGGYQYNAENISGLNYCINAGDGYARIHVDDRLSRIMDGFMDSPGHRDNILDPHHRMVNLGISYDKYNMFVVQHFEHDYVLYAEPPAIRGTILSFSGEVMRGATLTTNSDIGIQITYDTPPYELTRGQIARTYCYNNGDVVAAIRPPLSHGYTYTTNTFSLTTTKCPNPHDIPANTPPPSSVQEAHAAHTDATSQSIMHSESGKWYTARLLHVASNTFEVEVDISNLLNTYGNGVYTVVVWAKVNGADTPVSEVSLFYDGTPELESTYSEYENAAETTSTSRVQEPELESTYPGTVVEIVGGLFCFETNTCYNPHTVIINAGETVTWVEKNPLRLGSQIVSGTADWITNAGWPDGVFECDFLRYGESCSVQFDKPGTYPYYNHFGKSNVGVVIVLDDLPSANTVPDDRFIVHDANFGSVPVPEGWIMVKDHHIPEIDITATQFMTPEPFWNDGAYQIYAAFDHSGTLFDAVQPLLGEHTESHMHAKSGTMADKLYYMAADNIIVGTSKLLNEYHDDLLPVQYLMSSLLVQRNGQASPYTGGLTFNGTQYHLTLINIHNQSEAYHLIDSVCSVYPGYITRLDGTMPKDAIPSEIWCGDVNLQQELITAGLAELIPEYCRMAEAAGARVMCLYNQPGPVIKQDALFVSVNTKRLIHHYQVYVTDDGLGDYAITINPGDVISWINKGDRTSLIIQGIFEEEIDGELILKFMELGTYQYSVGRHTGIIDVVEPEEFNADILAGNIIAAIGYELYLIDSPIPNRLPALDNIAHIHSVSMSMSNYTSDSIHTSKCLDGAEGIVYGFVNAGTANQVATDIMDALKQDTPGTYNSMGIGIYQDVDGGVFASLIFCT